MTYLLIIADEERDLEVLADGEIIEVHLNDFAFVNASAVTFGGELVDDLGRLEHLPSELRQAGFRTIRGWLSRRADQLGRYHSETETAAAIAAWYSTLDAQQSADWDASAN